MKDVLKIMRFDFLTAKPIAFFPFVVITFFCFVLSLLFSPIICTYITFSAMVFVIPLQRVADRSGFNKLYGTLPVRRLNITRARFLYIFLVHFATELLEVVLAVTARELKLYRILPNQNSESIQMISQGFNNSFLTFGIIIGLFTFFCLMFTYIEMMGQIYGRENEFKIIMITIGVISALLFGFFALLNRGIIPVIQPPDFPTSSTDRVTLAILLNIFMLGLSVLFGEITAHKLAKREL